MNRSLLPDLILDRPLRRFPSLLSNLASSPWSNLPLGLLSNIAEEELLPWDLVMRGARIYEENNHLHVEVPAPGLKFSDIEVSLNRGVLFIKGESREEEHDKKKNSYFFSERNVSGSIALPVQIDEKQELQAHYTDGILHIVLPLAKKDDTKKITVKASAKK